MKTIFAPNEPRIAGYRVIGEVDWRTLVLPYRFDLEPAPGRHVREFVLERVQRRRRRRRRKERLPGGRVRERRRA